MAFTILGVRTFRPDLYLAAVTVIPVLLVAVLVPGGVLARYASWAKGWRSRHARPIVSAERVSVPRLWLVLRGYDILYLPVTATVVLTLEGLMRSISALASERASVSDRQWVLASLVGMVCLTVAMLMAAISQSWASGIGGRKESDVARRSSCRRASSVRTSSAKAPP